METWGRVWSSPVHPPDGNGPLVSLEHAKYGCKIVEMGGSKVLFSGCRVAFLASKSASLLKYTNQS
jgi:hypothetical protein